MPVLAVLVAVVAQKIILRRAAVVVAVSVCLVQGLTARLALLDVLLAVAAALVEVRELPLVENLQGTVVHTGAGAAVVERSLAAVMDNLGLVQAEQSA
jgi:uncharacterized membrane protein